MCVCVCVCVCMCLTTRQVRANPGNAEAWRLLGTVHAENDDDRQARGQWGASLCVQMCRACVLRCVRHALEARHGVCIWPDTSACAGGQAPCGGGSEGSPPPAAPACWPAVVLMCSSSAPVTSHTAGHCGHDARTRRRPEGCRGALLPMSLTCAHGHLPRAQP